ncbi:T9SS type A sorting domain-containing protein [Fibrella aquatilis]|uniref:T9SS type A sorting domain-containing protein n=1 Tax=Fibrella aquatilis TaxID=2817059 RepID=A0A939K0C3_9BACT|nr:T9SS type A sorting domain-containing protein [Fibrella aquatilis]MBO0934044.1 T9SS type A sorting domain-containing protein [Fibrella aquatilis]
MTHALRLTTAVLLVAFLTASTYQTALAQVTRYVSTTGISDPVTAFSWATSTNNLQWAIDVSSAGDVVWVAAGTYKPTATTNRTVSFSMKNGVAIYGGFRGNETALNQRPAVNPVTSQPSNTILSGDIGTPGDPADNSFHVISNRGNTQTGLTNTAMLDGFVITAGNAVTTNTSNPNDDLNNSGGGIYNGAFGGTCNPTIRNCLFQNNFALFGAGMGNDGYGQGTASPQLTNCLFQNNTAFTSGGALFNNGNFGTSSPMLTNCLFRANIALPSVSVPTTSGGAIYNLGAQGRSSPVLTNCGFLANRASVGGAMYNDALSGLSEAQLTNCAFQSNSATTGGAIHNQGGLTGVSRPALANSVFWNNGGTNTFSNDEASITTAYCLFESAVTGYNAGTGNLTNAAASPFKNTTSIALTAGSAAINVGNPASVTTASSPYSALALPTTDLVGNPRIVQNRVDMGAVEYTLSLLTAANPNPICAGSTVALSVTASEGRSPYSYTWVAPAGISLSGTSTSAVSASVGGGLSGVQTLTVLVADATTPTPLVNIGLVELLVNARSAATLSATPGSVLGCAQTIIALTATGGAPYTFTRLGGGAGIVSQNTTQGTAIINAPGTYSVVATGASGCTASAGVVITQNRTPPGATLTAIPSATLTCAQASLTLTATGNGAYAFSRVGGGAGIVTQNALAGTAVVNAAGTYSVTVTNTTTGCFSTTTLAISQNTATPLAILSPASTSVCAPGSVTLTATAGAATYAFSGPGGFSQNGSNNSIVVSQSGSYTVLVTGANGCTATGTASVTIQPRPSAPTLTPGTTFTTLNSTTPFDLTGLVQPATPPNTLAFYSMGGLLSPPNANVSTAGIQSFSVVQISAFGCFSPDTPFSLTVISPLPPVSYTLCRGDQLVLNVLPSGGRYEWYKNGQTAANKLLDVVGVQRGTTTASLTLVSVQTNATYYAKTFAANSSFSWSGPFAVVIGNCGSRVGTETTEASLQVRMSPNPLIANTLRATVSGAGGQRLTLQLLDLQGKPVLEQTWPEAAEQQAVEWNVSQQPAGMLLLRATTDRQSQTVKVLKE